MHGVNHHILLIDENKQYNYHLPWCPDSMKVQLMEKITRYMRAGWWESVQTDQAAPMLCIPKKSGLLCTTIDARKQNDNTVKDVMPFPDQDQIRLDVVRVKIWLKIDFSDVYEQICTVPEDVHKSVFTTIYGTYVSHMMQIGDCNAPATFQCVMTMIFQDSIGIFLHAYLDDLLVYSNSVDEHKKHLTLVFEKICKFQFYLKEETRSHGYLANTAFITTLPLITQHQQSAQTLPSLATQMAATLQPPASLTLQNCTSKMCCMTPCYLSYPSYLSYQSYVDYPSYQSLL